MSLKNLDREVSQRIALLRYPLIYLIVVVHVPWLARFADDPGVTSFLGEFIDIGLVRVSIPTLTCISAYLIFTMKLDQDFKTLIRKRASALLAPMIVWNLPLVILLYVIQKWELTPFQFNPSGQMYPFDLMQWLNGVFAITDFPIVGPMHFMRDLFIVSFFAPLMGWVIRRAPWVGLLVVIAIFYPGLDGPLMRTDSIPISFYIGAMAAVKGWNLNSLDAYAVPIGCALVLICAAVVLFQLGRPSWLPVIAPLLVWPLSSALVNTRAGHWFMRNGQAAIFLFMFHGLVLIFLLRAFPDYQRGQFELLIWLVTPLAISILSHLVYRFLAKHLPGLLSLLLGGRRSQKA